MNRSSLSRKAFFQLTGGVAGLGLLSYVLGLRNQRHAVPAGGLPAYRDEPSAFPVLRGPYLQRDAQLAALLFPADLAALTHLCDQTLNSVPDSPFTYTPLMANVLVIYADMLVSSLDARDSNIGLIPETEAGFWLLTLARQKTAAGTAPHHLAWFLPFLFVDEGNSIATGREVYGFNKQQASFARAQDIQSPQFGADVLGFEHFGSEAIARKERLLEVSSPASQSSAGRWSDWQTARSELSAALLPQVRGDLGDGIVRFAAQTALQDIPLVFLRQFRHPAEPDRASCQAIVEAPLQIKTFQAGGFLDQPGQLKLRALDSHPLIRALGLHEAQASTLGAWLKVDFVLGLGREYRLG